MEISHAFAVNEVQSTYHAAENFLGSLDGQIDELQTQLANLQACRAAVARTFGVDRRAEPTPVGKMIDGANRAHFEGKADLVLIDALEKEFVK